MTSRGTQPPESIPLWPGAPPGSELWTHQEQEGVAPPPFNTRDVRNVSNPSLLVYLPDPARATGTAVIVAPGGAFHGLAIEHEGIDVARRLNARGVAAFVLKYRLLPTPRDDEEFARQMRATMQLPVAEREARLHQAVDPIVPLAVADGRRAMQLVRERAAEWD
ncbi:MAG: G-D-S-L family lipolytic protein, partial [Chloroflexi bacterium]|nr:G-D-S-L family lipolytic protein [Chloroflexota bacterium]